MQICENIPRQCQHHKACLFDNWRAPDYQRAAVDVLKTCFIGASWWVSKTGRGCHLHRGPAHTHTNQQHTTHTHIQHPAGCLCCTETVHKLWTMSPLGQINKTNQYKQTTRCINIPSSLSQTAASARVLHTPGKPASHRAQHGRGGKVRDR